MAKEVENWRDYLRVEMSVPGIHTRSVEAYQVGRHGAPPFSKKFLRVVEHPPSFLGIHRRRKWPERHFRERHLASPEKCRCRKRLGFRLVESVVVWRNPIEDSMRRWKLTETFALTVLGDELRTIENIMRKQGVL